MVKINAVEKDSEERLSKDTARPNLVSGDPSVAPLCCLSALSVTLPVTTIKPPASLVSPTPESYPPFGPTFEAVGYSEVYKYIARYTQMAGTKRGHRPPRAAGRREEASSHTGQEEGQLAGKSTAEAVVVGSAVEDQAIEEIETYPNALMSTPQSNRTSNIPFGSADFSRPVAQSTPRGYFDTILVENTATPSQAHERLRLAVAGNGAAAAAATSSRLEEAENIDYNPTERDGEEDDKEDLGEAGAEFQNNELDNGHPTVGGLRVPRRSDRLRAKNRAAREPSPSTALSNAPNSNTRVQKRRKRALNNTSQTKTRLRRSLRLAKPLEAFHMYPELPPEIQLMIWEAATQARLIYICNRSSVLDHAHNFGVQNKVPAWFTACRMSAYIAQRHYKKLFGLNEMFGSMAVAMQPIPHRALRAQDVNTDIDIVVYEPCHSGCRAYFCAQQYRREDRAAVRRLAVQIDSPHLLPASEPGWVTVSRSWPNLTTLFMMRPAIKGPDRSDKAMIRIKEGDHEIALRKLFDAWKKGPGKDHSLSTLEFVRVVEQETDKDMKDRYQSVEDRKTGLVEDIILG
ncbi:hypothetical protein GGR50DRAFT_685224 [Xylaria sp. CBS 124048]|nr:hypothetical protein GGR50DRAFT_685224 [Xylaria sp. CBS 124048]